MGTAEPPGAAPRQPYWIWPFRPPPGIGDDLFRLAGAARCLLTGWRWLLTALAIGVIPLGVGYLLGSSLHHLAAALLLAPLLLACARDDRLGKFLAMVFLAGVAHSAVAITMAIRDPVGAGLIFPESDVYWRRTEEWVLTGSNPDYEPAYWVPLQLRQLAGLLAMGYTTFGLLPLSVGLRQLDVMNYYVGRLVAVSENPVTAIAAGWHPWSFLRVVGYSLLLYEVTSCSLERFTGRTLSTRRRRLARWAVGLAFCVADGVVKYLAIDSVRQILYDNLSP